MKRQQRVVDLGKIMAIPQRLEILTHHGLQRGTGPRNPSELGERGMQRRKMMQHVDAGDRVHRARAQWQSRRVGKDPPGSGFLRADFNHRRRTIDRSHREAGRRQRRGVVASAGADFKHGSSAQRPQTFDQCGRNSGFDAPRIVIGGGNLAVVDRSGNWHGKNSRMLCSNRRCARRRFEANANALTKPNRRAKKTGNDSRRKSFSTPTASLIC